MPWMMAVRISLLREASTSASISWRARERGAGGQQRRRTVVPCNIRTQCAEGQKIMKSKNEHLQTIVFTTEENYYTFIKQYFEALWSTFVKSAYSVPCTPSESAASLLRAHLNELAAEHGRHIVTSQHTTNKDKLIAPSPPQRQPPVGRTWQM